MATTSVFVDDAVRGELPPICVKTGEQATRWVPRHKPIGGMGAAAWLLVFVGPLGWIVLFVLAVMGSGREMLTIQLPYSESGHERHVTRSRLRNLALGISTASLVAAVLTSSLSGAPSRLLVLIALVALVVGIVAHVVVAVSEVDVTLDASRRWVTLHGVHPSFAAAVSESSSKTLPN